MGEGQRGLPRAARRLIRAARANSEIAETLGIGVAAVKTRVHRARLFVRKQLSDVLPLRNGTAAALAS